MTAHTPGPWHVQDGTYHPYSPIPVIGSHRDKQNVPATIASVATRNILSGEAEANAALIAAAPELLAALRDLTVPLSRGWIVSDMTLRLEAARAAIAKAEGTEP